LMKTLCATPETTVSTKSRSNLVEF
jgi:hypothetical protein